jgi:hypothetical protein
MNHFIIVWDAVFLVFDLGWAVRAYCIKATIPAMILSFCSGVMFFGLIDACFH